MSTVEQRGRDRVAVVSHSHPSVSKGGAEVAAFALYSGLLELGVDAIFVAACSEEDRSRIWLGSPREHAIIYRPRRYDHFYQLAHFETAAELAALLERERVTIVNFHHFFNFGMGAVRAIAARPDITTVLTLHEFLAICHNHGQMVTRPAQNLCERSTPSACSTCFPEHTRQQFALRKMSILNVLRQCDGFISPSRFLAERFAEWGLDGARITMIENGLQRLSLRTRTPRKYDGRPWVFGYFGQINPFKGVDILLRAADLLARDEDLKGRVQFRLHGNLVGDNAAVRERVARDDSGGSSVAWSGPYDNENVGRLMGECDYVVVPSKWWENSPVVIQEAFAAGCPVICSGIGGMAEKAPEGWGGLHFRVGDAYDLARTLRKAADPAVHEAIQSLLPTPYDHAEMARRYIAFFDYVGGRAHIGMESEATALVS
jgi:glycosyltransferase involved in cell wall biosynthesis